MGGIGLRHPGGPGRGRRGPALAIRQSRLVASPGGSVKMEGNLASGSRRTKALAVLAALSVGVGAWVLTASGSGTLQPPISNAPFGPNAFALSRGIVGAGSPSPTTSTTTTSAPPTSSAPNRASLGRPV